MSRTIRRKNAEHADWHTSYFRQQLAEETSIGLEGTAQWLGVSESKDLYQCYLKKKYHNDGWFAMNNPSWWIHLHDTVKRRTADRAKIRALLHLEDLEEAPLFDRKLKVPYYW